MKPRLLVLLALLGSVSLLEAEDRPGTPTVTERERRRAVDRGLDYIASNQNRDGSWGSSESGMVGISALALLALMAQGHQEGRGKYARGENDVIRKGVDFLLKRSLPPKDLKDPTVSAVRGYPTGYIYLANDGDSRMHGHGYATQVLILAYGSTRSHTKRSRELKVKIQRAIWVIENSQNITGGWGYEPRPATPHEGSVTVTVVQALRLAADAGFVVDKEVHKRGLRYLRDSQKDDGSFKYSLMSDHSSAALTAAALTAMHGFGDYYSKAVRNGLKDLRNRYRHPHRVQWPFYAHYYGAQVFYRAGGEHWRFWTRTVVPHILSMQRTGGYWDDRQSADARRGSHGRVYATAFSCLALSVSDGYLPLFQR